MSTQDVDDLVAIARRDGFVVIDGHFSRELLAEWNEALQPLLQAHIARVATEDQGENRGSARHYVTLPFTGTWMQPALFDDDLIVAVAEGLVGKDLIMCQLATDTPLRGSSYQDVHRDAPPLFPELHAETPAFQLAVNFPLVDVTRENGPIEIARGTHMMTKEDGLTAIAEGRVLLEPIEMALGDVMIRDVRGLHRGTPNLTDVARPMVVIGYSRRWLYRPEVHIVVPRDAYATLSPRAQHMLRHNPIVDAIEETPGEERYQAFAY